MQKALTFQILALYQILVIVLCEDAAFESSNQAFQITVIDIESQLVHFLRLSWSITAVIGRRMEQMAGTTNKRQANSRYPKFPRDDSAWFGRHEAQEK